MNTTQTLHSEDSFEEIVHTLSEKLKALRKEAKDAVSAADKRDKKSTQAEYDERIAVLTDDLTIAKEAHWLYEKFGDGEYQDVLGLCKAATLEERGCGRFLGPELSNSKTASILHRTQTP